MTTQPQGDQALQRDEYAVSYESVRTTKFHSNRTAEANAAFFLPYLSSGMSLLDCGCGSGSITVGLAERVAPGQVTGVDVGESVVEAAQIHANDLSVANVQFQVASVYELPFPEGAFDAVFTHNMVEHLQEPQTALAEMLRVLKPGGVLGVRDIDGGGMLISGPNEDYVRQMTDVLFGNWDKVSGSPYIGRRLKALLREAGFVRVSGQASYDSYPTQESLIGVMEIFASTFEERSYVDKVTENGISNEKKMREIAHGLREFGKHPDSFLANAHCEVVGWKE